MDVGFNNETTGIIYIYIYSWYIMVDWWFWRVAVYYPWGVLWGNHHHHHPWSGNPMLNDTFRVFWTQVFTQQFGMDIRTIRIAMARFLLRVPKKSSKIKTVGNLDWPVCGFRFRLLKWQVVLGEFWDWHTPEDGFNLGVNLDQCHSRWFHGARARNFRTHLYSDCLVSVPFLLLTTCQSLL